jgi:predicted RNA-binding Zn ribbon-like protein
LRIEDGLAPGDEFLQEINSGLVHHPLVMVLSRRKGQIVREPLLNLSRPSDLWAPLLDGAADLLSEREVHRIRKCEACVPFLRHQQEGLAALVQYEYLWQ